MKIAIIGSGSSASITAAYLHRYHRHECDIEIYHDPKINIEPVGQAALLLANDLFFQTYDWDWYDNPIQAVLKTGSTYEGWGKKKDKFFHPFPMESVGMHFIPNLLSDHLLNCGLYKIIEKTIVDPEEDIDADWIYDCRGRSQVDYDNYHTITNPLNSVIIGRTDAPDPELIWTRSIATADGWTFGIPNKDSVSYGYLYNNTVTDIETATSNFKNQFGLDVINSFSFKNYKAKSVWSRNKTILQGNKYGFVEPLEATSMAMYQYIVDVTSEYIFDSTDWSGTKYNPIEIIDDRINHHMYGIENFLMWHYKFGSKYDTPFWQMAKDIKYDFHSEFNKAVEYATQHDQKYLLDHPQSISQWQSYNIKNWVDNVVTK